MTTNEITELEKVIIGSIIQKESLLDSHFLEKHIIAEMFTDTRNQLLYANLVNMHYIAGMQINSISLIQYLATSNQLEPCGGAVYIAEIEGDGFPSNIDFYIEQLQEVFLKRETVKKLRAAMESVEKIDKVTTDDVTKIIADFSQLTEIAETTKIADIKELFALAKNETEKAMQTKEPTGILSGFDVFDTVSDGFQKGELSILAARPSIGKTSLALSMCMNIAKAHPVAFISLETPDKMIAFKITGLLADTPIFQLRKGFLTEQRYKETFEQKAAEFQQRNFFLVDKTSVDIMELKSIVRRLVLQYGIEIVFVDYIGLVDAGSSNMPVYEKQSIVSRFLKEMAREFNIAICALCQVSRGAEGQNKPPLLSDLRGSGSIEQDADVVMFIHGNRIIPKDERSATRELIIAKNRNGECTLGKINFVKATAKYENLKKEEDIPQ